jgi:hypothetical protein
MEKRRKRIRKNEEKKKNKLSKTKDGIDNGGVI